MHQHEKLSNQKWFKTSRHSRGYNRLRELDLKGKNRFFGLPNNIKICDEY